MFSDRLSAKPRSTFGSARWADKALIFGAGLFADRGIVLGQAHGRYLRQDGPEHALMVAPTRSGKGIGVVVPTLLSWTGSPGRIGGSWISCQRDGRCRFTSSFRHRTYRARGRWFA
jgi:hypothetical protein